MNLNNILYLREARNLTQKELATKAGISLATLNACENFKRNLTEEQMKKLAAALEVSENFFTKSPSIVDDDDVIFLFTTLYKRNILTLEKVEVEEKNGKLNYIDCIFFEKKYDPQNTIFTKLSEQKLTIENVLNAELPAPELSYLNKKFASKVEFLILRSGKDKGTIARECKVTVGELQQLIAGKRTRSFSFLEKLSYSLSCSVSTLLDDFSFDNKNDIIQFFYQLVLSNYTVLVKKPNEKQRGCALILDQNLMEKLKAITANRT